MRAMVVDPGKVTGVGFLDWEPGGQADFEGWEMPHYEFLEWANQWLAHVPCTAEDALERPAVDLVVCEGFTASQRTAKEDPSSVDGLWSVKQIGCLEFWCYMWGKQFRQQMPGDKAFADNGKLRAIGWWAGARGERGHRRDAARHAIKFGVDRNVIDPRRLLG